MIKETPFQEFTMQPIQTQRLIIRNYRPEDWRDLHAMIAQYQASPTAVYDEPWPTAPEQIEEIARSFAGGENFLVVCLKQDGRFIGHITVHPEGEGDGGDVNFGYIFNADFHGQGCASESCRAVLRYIFEQLRAARVVAGTGELNRPSRRLLEGLGFEKMGEAQTSFWKTPEGEPVVFTGVLYALTREEWRSRDRG